MGRSHFISATLAVLMAFVGLGWALLRSPHPVPPSVNVPPAGMASEEASSSQVTEPGQAAPAGPGPLEETASGPEARPLVEPISTDVGPDPLVVRGRLVREGTVEPCSGYTVLLLPAGMRPRAWTPALEGGTVRTDDEGGFVIDELDALGPWDVYASSGSLTGGTPRPARSARVGTIRARAANDSTVVVLEVSTGPLLVLSAPLPPGLSPEELMVEWRAGRGSIAADRWDSSDPCARSGFASAALDATGRVVARLPRLSGVQRGDRLGVRVVSIDGRYGLAVVLASAQADREQVDIDLPLSRRGVVRVSLSLESGDASSVEDEEWIQAASMLEWMLPQGDPERDELGLPGALATSMKNRCWHPVGERTFELRDLPVGAIEIGDVIPAQAGAALQRGALLPASLSRTSAQHGEPLSVPIRIRRIR